MGDNIYIIVPYKNGAQIAKQFIEFTNKIIEKYSDVFFVIVNDHSTDGTDRVLSEYFENQKQGILINSDGEGVSAARNTGLKHIYTLSNEKSNNWVIFCDFDDMLSPKLFDQLQKNDDWKKFDYLLFGVTSNNEHFMKLEGKNDCARIEPFILKSNYDLIFGGTFAIENIYFNMNALWAKIINVNFIKNNKLFFQENLTFREDLVFNLSILQHNPLIGICFGTYYYYFINPLSTVRTYVHNIKEQNFLAFNNIDNLLPNYLENKENFKKFFLSKSLIESMYLYVFNSVDGNLTYRDSQMKFNEMTSEKLYANLLKSTYFPKFNKYNYKVIYLLIKYGGFKFLFLLMKIKRRLRK